MIALFRLRRVTALALAALLCVPASAAVSAPASTPAPKGLAPLTLTAAPGERAARLRAGEEPVRSATARFSTGGAATGPAARGGWRVRGWRTDGFAQVGATWRGGDPQLQVRSRAPGGRWSRWTLLEAIEDGPTVGAGEGRPGLRAADLWWSGDARDVQLRARGGGYRDLRVVLIDPGSEATDARPVARPASDEVQARQGRQARKKPSRAPRPRIYSRRAWGANESWREKPRYISDIQAVHVHHTVNSNSYRRRDVPALIRGMYRYHVKSLGWSDIGYNILVDRFGRAWAGRAGGVGNRVRGAHTLGFNENGTGVAVIGNFESGWAPRPARWKVAVLAAWKLDKEGRNPAKWRRIRSYGSDRYRNGSRPRLPRVAGHRDTNQTACPGIKLYNRMGGIRRHAQKRVDQYS